jgi:hypothetical protein
MGLLEKAKQKKGHTLDEDEHPLSKTKKRPQPPHQTKTTKKVKDNNSPIEEYHIHTSEKTIEQQIVQQKQITISTPQNQDSEQGTTTELVTDLEFETQQNDGTSSDVLLEAPERDIEIIEEQTGFGWKEQGSKRIIYDHVTHDYIYEVMEPQLNDDEKQTKNEIAHLFKMLADIDTFDMTYEEKAKFLEETIERVISDNHIYIEEGSKDTIYYHIFRWTKHPYLHPSQEVRGDRNKHLL